jgi:hypothetical protein
MQRRTSFVDLLRENRHRGTMFADLNLENRHRRTALFNVLLHGARFANTPPTLNFLDGSNSKAGIGLDIRPDRPGLFTLDVLGLYGLLKGRGLRSKGFCKHRITFYTFTVKTEVFFRPELWNTSLGLGLFQDIPRILVSYIVATPYAPC